jgi:hypothetical protein
MRARFLDGIAKKWMMVVRKQEAAWILFPSSSVAFSFSSNAKQRP